MIANTETARQNWNPPSN